MPWPPIVVSDSMPNTTRPPTMIDAAEDALWRRPLAQHEAREDQAE